MRASGLFAIPSCALFALLPMKALAQVCPGTAWERAAPEGAGWSSIKLKAADRLAKKLDTGSYLVVVKGRIIWEYGDAAVAGNIHSMRKSIASLLFGVANDKGAINLDRTLRELSIDDIGGLSSAEKSATIRDLLSAKSCIYHRAAYETKEQRRLRPERHSCSPGQRWFYNNWDFNALGSIYQKVMRQTIFDGFETELAGPLQLEHFRTAQHSEFHREPKQSEHPAYLFRMSALDIARIGLLMSRGGDWCGRRIVSQRWVDESTIKRSDTNRNTGYGYLWWVGEDGTQFGVSFKGRTFSARGARGQFMVVNPARDLVIVHRVDTDEDGQRVKTRQFEELLAAIVAASDAKAH
jgi:CubicO group peptidase (beta-lactamase class C family)